MERPNILVVMTDHQRGDTVLAGHPVIRPNLDQLARSGLTLSQTYCPSPHCCPSRATFHTGLYPSMHGVWNNVCNTQYLSRGLSAGVRTWSEDLAQAGYRMMFTGKWHVSSLERPTDRGWEELDGHVSGTQLAEHADYWARYEQLARQGEGPASRQTNQIQRPGWGTYTICGRKDAGNQHDERAAALAADRLAGLGGTKDPWMMFVGLTGPHDPYFVPGKYLDLYDPADVPLPPSFADDLSDKPGIYRRLRRTRWGQLSQPETRDAIRHFWAYCTYLDDLLARVLEGLRRGGQADNTLVLYCSDHGDYCGDHGLFAKGIPCFRGAYHVPAIIRWPAGLERPGRCEDRFVSLADFGPTFLDLAGARVDRPLGGASLTPFVRCQEPPRWRDAIHTQCNGVELYYTQRSVATRRHKYVFNGFDEDELYDLQADPHEMRNLAMDPGMDDVKREMCRRMWRFARQQSDQLLSSYITVGLAPFGPAEAFADGPGDG